MTARPAARCRRPAHWLVVWCLLLAVPLYGLSSSITQMLGASHFHRAASAQVGELGAMHGWQDFRRMNHVADAVFAQHTHDALGRHHHAAGDAGVVEVGADSHGEPLGDAGVSAGAAFVFVAGEAVDVVATASSTCSAGWAEQGTGPIRSCDTRRLERPPQA